MVTRFSLAGHFRTFFSVVPTRFGRTLSCSGSRRPNRVLMRTGPGTTRPEPRRWAAAIGAFSWPFADHLPHLAPASLATLFPVPQRRWPQSDSSSSPPECSRTWFRWGLFHRGFDGFEYLQVYGPGTHCAVPECTGHTTHSCPCGHGGDGRKTPPRQSRALCDREQREARPIDTVVRWPWCRWGRTICCWSSASSSCWSRL